MIHGYQVRTHYTRHKRCLPTEAAKQSRSKLLAGAQIIMHLLLCLNGPKVHFSVGLHDTKSLSKRRLICWDSFSSLIRWDGRTLVANTFPGNLVIYVEKFHFEFCPAENCKKKKMNGTGEGSHWLTRYFMLKLKFGQCVWRILCILSKSI